MPTNLDRIVPTAQKEEDNGVNDGFKEILSHIILIKFIKMIGKQIKNLSNHHLSAHPEVLSTPTPMMCALQDYNLSIVER